ncbi:glycine cleavage system protein R [Aliikangiella coralliicola]|uniref:Glycine cleavage system transcriptional repressor n=1 Tax=Aliikangiella coralliicola TaxID=2592383 RepID=A0A545U8K3_9GAMM|nr:ACT domain-containing protein [Aliikangiella coralliicola]TQV85795.1 glycine cleavage system protein R [Aliikangiella coralliicola]
MSSQLVISAIAPDRPGIAHEIISLVTDCGCNITESKMKAMGNTFSLVLMAKGEWNALAKLEHILPNKASSLGMTTMMQRTGPTEPRKELPYRVKVIALDYPGISKDLTNFFADQKIEIQEMSCNTYPAVQTGAMIGSIKLTVGIPSGSSVSEIRERFNKFCAKTNLDGNMEPIAQ